MKTWPDQLYRLLPAIHQIRDGEQGDVLRAWLHVIGEQVRDLQDDIAQLYDNSFIETCDDWVVPYLGDLVGYRNVESAGEPGDAGTVQGRMINRFLFPRREIANLVRRRRRKGTLSVLEDVARDVTGWPTRAVEFSRLVNFFQHIRHPMPDRGGTLKVSDREVTSRVNTPFDQAAHTVDVRNIQSLPGVGWYHPKKVGLFAWRRKVYSLTYACPMCLCENTNQKEVRHYTFSRMGQEIPLYVRPISETDELSIADERNLPVPLTRDLLRVRKPERASTDGGAVCQQTTAAEIHPTGASEDYYGVTGTVPMSLAIYVRWTPAGELEFVPKEQIFVCCLDDCHQRRHQFDHLPCRAVAVDPETGRFIICSSEQPVDVRVTYHYSMPADMGGGEYDRRSLPDLEATTVRITSDECCHTSSESNLLRAALNRLSDASTPKPINGKPCEKCNSPNTEHSPEAVLVPENNLADPHHPRLAWTISGHLCIELIGSQTFHLSASENIHIGPESTLEIRAANGCWPLLQIASEHTEPLRVVLGKNSRLMLDGLQIVGATVELSEGVDRPVATMRPKPTSQCVPCVSPATPRPVADTTCADIIEITPVPRIDIRHTTFVPGGRADHQMCDKARSHPSLTTRLSSAVIRIRHSIVGTTNVEHEMCRKKCDTQELHPACPVDPIRIEVSDSILDASAGLPVFYANCCHPAHAELSVERSTILGDVCVQQIARAEDSIFAGVVHVVRRGIGYMRFCYVPGHINQVPQLPYSALACQAVSAIRATAEAVAGGLKGVGSIRSAADSCLNIKTPQRFKCVPSAMTHQDAQSCSTGCGDTRSDAALSGAYSVQPQFVSVDYGAPGYCQLALTCPREIFRGAEDESELGAFHNLYQPQRMAALEARLQEYTPADMLSAVIYADDLQPFTYSQSH